MDEFFAKIYELLIVFFGGTMELVNVFKKIEFTNFSCMEVE